MQQVWEKISVTLDSYEQATLQAQIIDRSDKTKDVEVIGNKVFYKQLTWKDGYDKEGLDEN